MNLSVRFLGPRLSTNPYPRYDPVTGRGAIGVEFAGTAVTSTSAFGAGILPPAADAISSGLVKVNDDLQWSEGSYRGFFTLTISPDKLLATYYAMKNISEHLVFNNHILPDAISNRLCES